MARLTKAQLEKWNGELSGGYYFDWKYYLMHSGEKVARKNVKLEDGNVLQATLEYMEVRDRYRSTGKVKPCLHLAIWRPSPHSDGVMTSQGLGKWIVTGEEQDRKLWKELCRLSALYSDEQKLLQLMQDNMAQLNNPFIL